MHRRSAEAPVDWRLAVGDGECRLPAAQRALRETRATADSGSVHNASEYTAR